MNSHPSDSTAVAVEWANNVLINCKTIDDLDKCSDVEWVAENGEKAGLNGDQIAIAYAILLKDYLKAIGRA